MKPLRADRIQRPQNFVAKILRPFFSKNGAHFLPERFIRPGTVEQAEDQTLYVHGGPAHQKRALPSSYDFRFLLLHELEI